MKTKKSKQDKLREKVLGKVRNPVAKQMALNKGEFGARVVQDKKKTQHKIKGNKGNLKQQLEQEE